MAWLLQLQPIKTKRKKTNRIQCLAFSACITRDRLTSARVRLSADCRFPREVVEKVLARLAVEAFGVVGALALAVHHVWFADRAVLRQAPGRVPITRTTAPNYHLGDAVVIFFLCT